jgi:succinate dehydrogenase / fumarate reductase, iron-sulfur subunit
VTARSSVRRWTRRLALGAGPLVLNASAALLRGAKISHLGLLPQDQAERSRRALRMVRFNAELFGSCTNIGECEAVCPKEIRLDVIARMNHDYLKAKWEDRS